VSWAWLALVDERRGGADAAVRTLAGEPIGVLAAWRRYAKPVRHARRIGGRIVDPDGASARVSLVLPPAGVRLAFDDVAVQQARRELLAGEPFDAASTLLTDDSHGTASSIRRAISSASACVQSGSSTRKSSPPSREETRPPDGAGPGVGGRRGEAADRARW
jgi:hypothetical protein